MRLTDLPLASNPWSKMPPMKKASLYARASSPEENEAQLADLRIMAAQRGYVVTSEHKDCISGAKAKRPMLVRLLADAQGINLTPCSSPALIAWQKTWATF